MEVQMLELEWPYINRKKNGQPNHLGYVSGELFEGTGLSEVLDAPAPGQARLVDLGYRDVVTTRFAIERSFEGFALRGGYAVRPSPAPVQVSDTNYVDGTAHHIGLGVRVDWQDPWKAFANPVIADLGLQALYHPSRRHQKIDSTDDIGSYDASGFIWVIGFSLSYKFEEEIKAEVQSVRKES